MATMNAPATERRHIPERRSTSTHSTRMSALDWVAMALMIIGGLNWGLVGALDFNLVAALFGDQTPLTRLIYVVVGLASLYGIYSAIKMSRKHA